MRSTHVYSLTVLCFLCAIGASVRSGAFLTEKLPAPLWSIAPTGVRTAEGAPGATAAVLSPDEALPGMPPVLNPHDVYSETRAGVLSPVVQGFPSRVYVPNSVSNTVDVIDPQTYTIIDHLPVGQRPQHVTPSYDLKTLWVLNNVGNSLTRIDPATGRKGATVRVKDPYNMYYTPDGRYAIVVAERMQRLDFCDPETMELVHSLAVPCKGVDHLDFSANGRYLIA